MDILAGGLMFLGFMLMVSVAIWIEVDPNMSWFCLFGKHKYGYVGEKHGMHIGPDGGVVGTRRNLYQCRCGARKPIEKSDYID